MRFHEAFVDELEKAAVVGIPLGRTLADPEERSDAAKMLKRVRQPFFAGEKKTLGVSEPSPEGARTLLAGLRGSFAARGRGGSEESSARAASELQSGLEGRRLDKMVEAGKLGRKGAMNRMKRMKNLFMSMKKGRM